MEHEETTDDDRDFELRSPLWLAVLQNRGELAGELLENGADVHEFFDETVRDEYSDRYDSDVSLLYAAIDMKSVDLVIKLISHGANTNWQDSHDPGHNLLDLAVSVNCPTEIIEVLLNHGADVNAVNSSNHTVLHEAVLANDCDAVKLLMERGADSTAKSEYSENALHLAATVDEENLTMVELLIEAGVRIDEVDGIDHNTPLHAALKNGNERTAGLLIEKGADVNVKTKSGYSPLHLAIRYNSAGMAHRLLAKGADVRGKIGTSEKTTFHLACYQQSPNYLHLLFEYGFRLDEFDCSHYISMYRENMIGTEAILKQLAKFNSEKTEPFASLIAENIPDELRKFYEACLCELKRMEERQIYNDITFYRILLSDKDKIANLLRNEDFVSALESHSDYGESFPVYRYLIYIKLMRARERYNYLKELKATLNDVFLLYLPDTVLNKIMHYLS